MGGIRNWQDRNGQRSLILEILVKTVKGGITKDRRPKGFTINDIFGVCPRFHNESITICRYEAERHYSRSRSLLFHAAINLREVLRIISSNRKPLLASE